MIRRQKIFIQSEKKNTLEKARGRILLLSAFFFVLFSLVGARLFDLSVLQAKSSEEYIVLDESADDNIRADIIDRNGVLLARSLKVSSLYADPKMIMEPEKTAKELANIFPDLSYGSVLKKLQADNRFAWIKRNIDTNAQVKINEIGDPGLAFKKEYKRIYPQESLPVHLVGTTDTDMKGLSGVERSFNDYLEKRNKPLELSLDVRLQHILKREINKTIKLHKAKGGVGIIMDVNNGEVVAATSLPDYDPVGFKDASDNSIFNRITLGVYELGSTFKIFSTAALIEKNNTPFAEEFDVREPIKAGRFTIRDYHPEKRVLSLPEVFIHSSNIGSALMGQEIGKDYLKSFYRDLGLLNAPDFEVNEIGKPIVPASWGEVHTMTTSYGHGIAVSPLQLVRAGAMIVNGGYAIQPTMVRRDKKEKYKTRIISSETSHRMRQLLRLVVTQGTGSKAEVKDYLVGGKTGTAEKPGKGGYSEKKLISSFLGFFPMNKPQYAVFVMIDEPEGIDKTYGYATGGWVGAPTVSRVISSMTNVLGLKPEKSQKDFGDNLLRFIKTKEQIKKEQEIAAH